MSDDLAPVYDVYEKEEAPKAQPQSTAPVVPPSLNNSSAGLPTGPLPNDIPALNPNALTPGQLNIPPIPSTQELQKKTEEKQKEMGPAVAANPLSQINLRQYLHDMIDNDMVLGGIGGAGLAYGASKLFNKQAPKKVEERDISKLERKEPSFQGYGDELITPAAEREMKDPVIRDGIRESQLKSFINSDKLPTNKDELDLIAKSFQQTHGMTNNAPVNLGQGMNTSAGEPSDFTIPTTQNIGTKINQPGPAVQGNVEVPADSTPVHTQEEQNLEAVAQTPAEATKTAEVAHKDVQEAFVPQESPITNAEPKIEGAVKPIENERNIFDETLPSSTETKIPEAVPPKATKTKTPKEPKVPTIEGLSKAQNSMRNYFVGSQGFTPEQYDEFVTKVYGGKYPEMGPKGGGLVPEDQATYKGYRKENIEGPKINLTRDMKKTLKAGGVASLLTLPAFINAKTQRDFTEARQNLGESLLPIGATPTEAGAPGLTPEILESQRQATLLGSPYRKSVGVKPPAR